MELSDLLHIPVSLPSEEWAGTACDIDAIAKRKRDGRLILKWLLKKCGIKLLAGFSWLRIGFGGKLL
jgi:hypothetical protein